MTQFLSFVVPSLQSNLSDPSKIQMFDGKNLPGVLNEIAENPREMYYSPFSYDPAIALKSGITGYKGVLGLSLDSVVFDFDHKPDPSLATAEANRFIKEFNLEPGSFAHFFSGLKGSHVHVSASLFGGLLGASEDLNERIKKMVIYLQDRFIYLDESVYLVTQKLRAPYSIHKDSRKQKGLLDGSWPLEQYPFKTNTALTQAFIAAQMNQAARPAEVLQSSEEEDSDFAKKFNSLKDKPCITSLMGKKLADGNRHHEFMVMVFTLLRSGHTPTQVRAKLKSFISVNNPSEREAELERHFKDFQAGKPYRYYCREAILAENCDPKCSMFSDLSAETLDSRPLPKGISASDLEKTLKKTALIRVKKFAADIIAEKSVVYVNESQTFYAFDGEKYKPVDPLVFGSMFERTNPAISNIKNNSELVATIKRKAGIPLENFLASTSGYINFKNGHFNKATGELETRLSARYFTYCLGFDYQPQARAPLWDAFLDQCFMDRDAKAVDAECKTALEEFFGATLSGEINYFDKMLLAVGHSGANGKGTIWNTVRHLVGEEGYSSLDVGMLCNPKERESIDGKLANLSGEESSFAFIKNEAPLKSLSSRDAVSIRPLFKKSYNMVNRAKLWMACNEVPTSGDKSGGWKRRFIILRFNNKAVDLEDLETETQTYQHGLVYRKDVGIEDRLKSEASGIFNRVWAAYQAAKARGSFTNPASSKQELLDQEMGDPLTETIHFLFEQGGPDDKLTSKEIVDAINDEFHFRKIKVVIGGNRMIAAVKNAIRVKSFSTGKVRGLRGIKKTGGYGADPARSKRQDTRSGGPSW